MSQAESRLYPFETAAGLSVPLRIGYVVVWQTVCGLFCLLMAFILLTPTTFEGGVLADITETLTDFSSSNIFRWSPSTAFMNAVLFVILAGYGGTMLAQLPGLLQYKARARLISLIAHWIGFLLAVAYMVRQMTVNRNLLYDLANENAAGKTTLEDITIRLSQGLQVMPMVLVFGIAALFLFQRVVAVKYQETLKQREAIFAYLYLSPYLLTATIFTIGLLILAFYLSFNDLDLFGKAAWVGFDNYKEALEDTRFLISLSNIVWYALIVVVFQTAIALILAVLMNDSFAGRQFFRTTFYAPSVTSPIVISLIFLWLFSATGFVNDVVFRSLKMGPTFSSLGVDVPPGSPGLQWYNTPNRLGDILYLRPFFNDTWQAIFVGAVVLLGLLLIARIYQWVRYQQYDPSALPVILGSLVGVSFGLTILGAILFGFDVEALARNLPRYSVLGMIITALAINRLRPAAYAIRAIHNFVMAVSMWGIVMVLLGLLLGNEPHNVSYGVDALGWSVLGGLLGTFFASSSFEGPRTLTQYQMQNNNSTIVETIPQEEQRSLLDGIAAFGGLTLPILIGLFIVVVVALASETAPYSRVGAMSNERFTTLLTRGPSIAFMTIMLQNIFTTAPTFMLLYLAALQDIPRHLYEAAQIDGANRLQRFWLITVPMLRPVTLLIVVLSTIGTFQLFDQVAILTQGDPANTTMVPVYLIYTTALGDNVQARVGYASAMAFILGAIIFVFTLIQRRYLERGTEQL